MAIQCKNLSFKDRKQKVLENLCLNLPDGQITALYGPTESGKTVLLLILAGLMKPSTGEVEIDGLNVTKKPREARRRVGLGVIPGFSPLLAKLTLKENLQIQGRTLGVKQVEKRVQELFRFLEMENYANVLSEDLPALVCSKASLALALLNDPMTLLFDEPEYRLTSEETEKIWRYLRKIKQSGKCIVISTRYQEVAAKCDMTLDISFRKVGVPNGADAMGLARTKASFA